MAFAIFFLSACSYFDGGEKEGPPLPGERISVLERFETGTDQAFAESRAIRIAPPVPNADWAQDYWNASNNMPSLETGAFAALERIWQSDIGSGGNDRIPQTAQPVIKNGRVFTLDTKGSVRAFHNQTGKAQWTRAIKPKKEDESVLHGGLAADESSLYVSGGYGELVALNQNDGAVLWRTPLTAGSRAAPTVYAGRVYIKTLDNNLSALNAADGKILWTYEGVGETTGLLGTAPVAGDDLMVIAAFSSGDLVALRPENGAVLWSDRLINPLQMSALATLADIRAAPVIDLNDTVYAISYGGRMVAIDKRTGARLWTRELNGAQTPTVNNNTLFFVSAEGVLNALDAGSGATIWQRALPRFRSPEKREGAVQYFGPRLLNGQIALLTNDGFLLLFNPADGHDVEQINMNGRFYHAPLAAEGILYLVSQDGKLTAYR